MEARGKNAKRGNEKRLMKKEQLEKRPNKKSGQLKRFSHLPSQSSAELPTTCFRGNKFAKTKNLIVVLSDFLKINKEKKTISCLIFLKGYIISPKKCPKPVFASPALCDTVETSSALKNVQCPGPAVLIGVLEPYIEDE